MAYNRRRGESGRRVCSFSIISLHGTDLDLQGFCQLGHNNIIAYGTTPFQQILFVDGFHRFGQSQTVLRQTRSTPSRDVDMGGEHPFLINLGSQGNDRDDRRTDTALLTGVYVLTAIHEINISTLTHHNRPHLMISSMIFWIASQVSSNEISFA